MENYAFKSVAFGGFDKQDVIHYIEQTAKEAAAVQERLQKENEDLQTEADSLRTQVRELQTRLETETALREQAQSELEQERTARQGLEAFKPEAERLAAELERLRPEAEAYAQFRDRVGDIECDAHKRAAELEASTTARLRRTVELFRAQYVTLMSSFESTASHVTAELRKVEVNLSQLPRAMDQAGTELNELAALLEGAVARKGRHAEEPFPGRGKQRIGSGVPRFRLLAVCCRSVTFIHDVDLELHAFLKAAARRRERGRPRVQDQHRRKTAPQPGPCILVRLSLKRRYGLCSRRFPERLEQFENRVLNLHRRAAHGVTPSHGRVPGSSNTAPGVSVPAGGRPGMPALPSATSRSQLSALV